MFLFIILFGPYSLIHFNIAFFRISISRNTACGRHLRASWNMKFIWRNAIRLYTLVAAEKWIYPQPFRRSWSGYVSRVTTARSLHLIDILQKPNRNDSHTLCSPDPNRIPANHYRQFIDDMLPIPKLSDPANGDQLAEILKAVQHIFEQAKSNCLPEEYFSDWIIVWTSSRYITF